MTFPEADINSYKDDDKNVEHPKWIPSSASADAPSLKYQVQIERAQGPIIGDYAHVEQHFHEAPQQAEVDLAQAEANYRKQVVQAYNWLNFSGFEHRDVFLTDVPLEDIFVRLTLTVEDDFRKSSGEQNQDKQGTGEQNQDKQGTGEQNRKNVVPTIQKPIALDEALTSNLLIIGEPGAGKSTLLRWLAITFAQGRQQEPDRLGPVADADRLPIYMELGRLPDRYLQASGGEMPNWPQLLPEYLSKQMFFSSVPPQLLTQALADGRCLLLFDGLDEVADC